MAIDLVVVGKLAETRKLYFQSAVVVSIPGSLSKLPYKFSHLSITSNLESD